MFLKHSLRRNTLLRNFRVTILYTTHYVVTGINYLCSDIALRIYKYFYQMRHAILVFITVTILNIRARLNLIINFSLILLLSKELFKDNLEGRFLPRTSLI